MSAQIYHNPRCSKSRETLAILEEKGVQIEVIEYLKTPPEPSALSALLEKMGVEPLDMMRKNESVFKELGLADKGVNREALIAAMAENPVLIERPIVVTAKGAKICRPPELVHSLL